MTVWYRQLSGTEARLGVEITFMTDPEDGRFAAPDVAASWGRFRLFINGFEPTSAIGPGGEELKGVTWYLLPILEWMTQHWDAILHETKAPVEEATQNTAGTLAEGMRQASRDAFDSITTDALSRFWRDHALVSARDGGIFPNVVFRRRVNEVEVSWDEAGRPGSGRVRFLSLREVEDIGVREFAEVWSTALSNAVKALLAKRPSARLDALAAQIAEISSPDVKRKEQRETLLFGLGRTADETRQVWDELRRRRIKIPEPSHQPSYCQATSASAMFGCVDPRIGADDVAKLMDLHDHVRPMSPSFLAAARAEPCPLIAPWRSGYQLALDLREQLGLGDDYVPTADLLARLGLEIESVVLDDDHIRGVAIVHADATLIAVNESSTAATQPWSRETTIAHELGHVLFDRNLGVELALVSGPWAPRRLEQRANAFAAMLRMPESGVERLAGEVGPKPQRLVRAVADAYRTSYWASANHLRHLGFISTADREEILELLGHAPT